MSNATSYNSHLAKGVEKKSYPKFTGVHVTYMQCTVLQLHGVTT